VPADTPCEACCQVLFADTQVPADVPEGKLGLQEVLACFGDGQRQELEGARELALAMPAPPTHSANPTRVSP